MCCATRSTTIFTTLKREAFERRSGLPHPPMRGMSEGLLPNSRSAHSGLYKKGRLGAAW
jgi:hypothetical protein